MRNRKYMLSHHLEFPVIKTFQGQPYLVVSQAPGVRDSSNPRHISPLPPHSYQLAPLPSANKYPKCVSVAPVPHAPKPPGGAAANTCRASWILFLKIRGEFVSISASVPPMPNFPFALDPLLNSPLFNPNTPVTSSPLPKNPLDTSPFPFLFK